MTKLNNCCSVIGTRYVPWIEGGAFICCIMLQIVMLFYKRMKEAQFIFSMSDIITYVTDSIDDWKE
jgi:hypothetical protein